MPLTVINQKGCGHESNTVLGLNLVEKKTGASTGHCVSGVTTAAPRGTGHIGAKGQNGVTEGLPEDGREMGDGEGQVGVKKQCAERNSGSRHDGTCY